MICILGNDKDVVNGRLFQCKLIMIVSPEVEDSKVTIATNLIIINMKLNYGNVILV